VDKLIIGLIGVGTALFAVGVAYNCKPAIIIGFIFVAVGILLTRLTK
jgi:hypothetical protein